MPTDVPFYKIELPIKIDGVTDDQVIEFAGDCGVDANNTGATSNGYPIFEFSTFALPNILECANRIVAVEGGSITLEDLTIEERDPDVLNPEPNFICKRPSNLLIRINDDERWFQIESTGQRFDFGQDFTSTGNSALLWANTTFEDSDVDPLTF